MDSGEEAICEEYASSLEDLTFNSKPLINVLTMLAEENSQFAPNITNLIKNRIYQVPQQVKLPSLYLLDSIVKNVGGDYLHLVAQILEKTFTSVFEKADEKVRRDLYKLRHTWSQYFPAKLLYELDVAVNKFDTGWPIPTPPSPAIHINPKFLKKAENTSGIPSLTTDMSKPEEHQVLVDHQHRLTELERLQEEQLKLTDQEIQEHQMKRDLLLKKQQQERQLLLQQQQQQILQLRLQPDSQELSNGPTSSGAHVPVSTKGETTPNVQDTAISRDPRLRRTEQQLNDVQEPLHKLAVEASPVVVPESKPFIQPSREPLENQERIPAGLSRDHFNDSSGKTQFVRTSDGPLAQKTTESNHAVQNTTVKRLQHIVRVEPPIDKASRVEPRMHHDNREVTDSTHYDEVHRPQKPHYSRRRRNSGDWSGNSPSYNSVSEESDERHKTGFSRRKPGRGRRRRRSAEERRDKEKSDRGRGRNPKGRKRIQEPGNDRYKHASRGARRHEGPVHMEEVRPPFRDEQWPNDRDFHRRSDQPYGDNWRRDPREFSHGNENMGPGPGVSERLPLRERMEVESNSPVPFEARFAINHGQDNPMQGQEDFVRAGSPGMPGPRFGPIGPDQERTDNLVQFEHHFVAPDPEHLIREDGRTQFEPRPFAPLNADRPMLSFHNDPNDLWDKPSPEEPLAKKPRPLLSDVEIDVLRGRRGTSPPHRGPVSQPMSQEGFHNYPLDRSVQEPMEVLLPPDEHPFPRHPEAPLIHGPPERNFHRDFGAPHRKGEFRPRSPPLDPHQEWSPGFEIPRELMLDRQSEIMRQAERRLQAGDLTAEQHHELVDKLQQLYDLQRHPGHTMFPPEGMLPHPEHRAGPIIQPRMEELPHGQGGHIEGPPMGPRRPLPPRGEGPQEHGMMPLGGPIMGPDELPFPNDGFRGPPLEHNRPLAGHPVSMEGPIIRQERPLDSRLEGGPNPTFVHGVPMDDYHRPSRSQDSTAGLPPKQRKGQASPPNTPNTMMEKQAVDDLFRRLMLVGIIKVTPEPGSDSPKHAPSPAPPPPAPEIQIPQPLPAPAMPVLPLVAPQQPPQEDMTIPVIKLIPEELKRRHVGVITVLYEGLQCSSCGLRFPGEAATIYREHLDWHFRKNRREKDGKRIAHRQWYFTVKDWLSYEEISDPEERARSSFFDVNLGALDSPDPLASKEGTEISCPVLSGDSETEAACDICFEKFEQFWEETNEEWHYKAAVRVDGKTYHSLCYQDAKESQIHAEEEEDEDEGSPDVSMETDADGKSPEVDKNKSQDVSEDQQVKAPVDRKSEKDSRIVPEKTDEPADSVTAKNSRGKVVGVGDGKKGNDSVISSTDDNKDTETKGDQ